MALKGILPPPTPGELYVVETVIAEAHDCYAPQFYRALAQDVIEHLREHRLQGLIAESAEPALGRRRRRS